MEILAALLVLNVAAFVTSAEQIACADTVQCPCGNTGKNVTVCAADAKDDLCSRWSKCLTCQDGLDRCLECIDDRESGSCSPETGQPKLSRQKRQNYRTTYVMNPRRPQSSRYQQRPSQGYPTGPVQQGGGFCPELNSPKLGSIRCLSTNQVRTCVGRCLPGYSFEGRGPEYEITLTCTNGFYTPLPEFPPCRSGGYCDLIVQGSGSFNCTTGMDGTRCDIICDRHYLGRYFCYPGRPWQPNLPHCMRPKVTENCQCEYGGRCDSYGNCVCPVGRTGRNCETIVVEKQTCDDPGFVINGFRRHPDESDASVRQMFEEGDSVVYGCDSDEYALRGSSLLTCKSDGTWSKPLPKCIKTEVVPDRSLAFCRDPGTPANGNRRPQAPPTRRGFPQGTHLLYSCNPGYDLEGEKSLFCLVSGRWSSQRPECSQYREREVVEKNCLNPGPISNGKIAYSPPTNSRRRGQSPADAEFPEGGRLQYSCNSGYIMEGTETLTCLPDGGWSAPAPSCSKEVIYCPNPGVPTNGKITYYPPLNSRRRGQGSSKLDDPEFPEGGRLQYTCDRDFVLKGAEFLTCKSNGRWSSAAPSCGKVVIYCPNPGPIINGKIAYYPPLNSRRRGQGSAQLDDPEFPEGGQLQYTCDRDYVLEGTESLTCQSNGRWSATPPSCGQEVTYCPNPGPISNGKIAYHPPLNSRRRGQGSAELDDPEFPEGGRLHYICNRDYVLEGEEFLTCQPNGRWSAPLPSCEKASPGVYVQYCPVLGVFANGKISVQSALDPKRELPAGTRVEFSCYEGMDMEGENSLYCFRNGKWSSEMPKCKSKLPQVEADEDSPEVSYKYCRNPGPIVNGKMMYYPGFIRNRKKVPPPRTQLEESEFPPDGHMKYICDPGYALDGRDTIICQRNGEWSGEPPICYLGSSPARTHYCFSFGPMPNGRAVPFVPDRPGAADEASEDYPMGTRLEFSCNRGYSLQGPSNITCGAHGRWSEIPPLCITTDPSNMMYCVNPGPILNGQIRYFNSMARPRTGSTSLVAEDTHDYPEGTKLVYQCGDGFIMEGAVHIKCLSTGEWTDLPPKCVADCGRSTMPTTRRVLHGNKTIIGEWPWVVAIGVIRPNNFTQLICGGAVLNTHTIITAAHCLAQADKFVLYFGKYHRSDSLDDAQVLVRMSDKIIVHDEYDNATMDNDIALVKFKPKINFTDRIQPICLPSAESTSKNLISGRSGYVTGWGWTEKSLSSDELLMAKLPYVSNNDCIESFRRNVENFKGSLTQNMFCAGYKEGRSQATCRGDSGAPFVFYDKIVERYTLEGLVSFGIEGQCGRPGMYSVFAKVYRSLPWIYRNL